MSLLNILNAIPAAASRFGGSVIQQAPKAAARVPQAARSAGFDPLNQVPALFSRFGGSVIQQAPSARNLPSLRGIMPVAGAGMAGFSGVALDPMLRGSQYIQEQFQGLGLMPKPGTRETGGRVGSIPPKDRSGESYRDAELRLSAAARAAGGPSAGGGIGGGNMGSSLSSGFSGGAIDFTSPRQERAYRQEASSVAQQAAQNPELQRYEQQRAAAAASGDQAQMNAARDIGMQMWAKANPGLAAKVKPGQSGYEAIQGGMAGEAARSGFGYQMPQQIMMTPPPGVNVPQGLPAVQSIGAAETFGQKGLQLDPEMIKKFQGLLNQAKP